MLETIKGNFFSYLFSQPEYMLQLYQVMHPEDTETREEDFKQIIAQGNSLAVERCSDLGFQVRDKLIILVEAQSELSLDIPMRMLMRQADAYKDFVVENKISLYREKPVSIPRPEFYVVYTGTEEAVPEVLSLGGPGSVEAEVKVLRTNGSGNILDQYIQFCEILKKQMSLHGKTDEALSNTLHICMEQGVLASFLNSHMGVVVELITAIPFKGYDHDWKPEYKERMIKILERSDIVVVCQKPGASSYLERNRYMVDHADCLLAVYDIENPISRSGTAMTIRYAQKIGLPTIFIQPST